MGILSTKMNIQSLGGSVLGSTYIPDLTGSLYGTSSWALNVVNPSPVSLQSATTVGNVTSASVYFRPTSSYLTGGTIVSASIQAENPFTGTGAKFSVAGTNTVSNVTSELNADLDSGELNYYSDWTNVGVSILNCSIANNQIQNLIRFENNPGFPANPIGESILSTTGYTVKLSDDNTDPIVALSFDSSSKQASLIAQSNITLDSRVQINGNIASGSLSHAEGQTTTAVGNYSHTEGRQTTAVAWAHAEGYLTVANGNYSHAEGMQTTAAANQSHAEGYQTVTRGQYSHTEGFNTFTTNQYAHAEGTNTHASGAYSHAEGGGLASSGYSPTKAIGAGSHAEGVSSTAIGSWSHAEGSGTTAVGAASHAEGWATAIAVGDYSHAEGRSTTAGTTAGHWACHAEGESTTAIGLSSHAEGYATKALANHAHSEGSQTTAAGIYSHAEGLLTLAAAQGTHVEGVRTTALADAAHAEGSSTTAIGIASHAEGWSTTAKGQYSHAEGTYTIAEGYSSVAMGNTSIASGSYQVAMGAFNTIQPTNAGVIGWRPLVVGIGSNGAQRKNAFEVVATTITAGGEIGTAVLPCYAGLNYASDAAAAGANIPLGGLYHNAGAVRVRIV